MAGRTARRAAAPPLRRRAGRPRIPADQFAPRPSAGPRARRRRLQPESRQPRGGGRIGLDVARRGAQPRDRALCEPERSSSAFQAPGHKKPARGLPGGAGRAAPPPAARSGRSPFPDPCRSTAIRPCSPATRSPLNRDVAFAQRHRDQLGQAERTARKLPVSRSSVTKGPCGAIPSAGGAGPAAASPPAGRSAAGPPAAARRRQPQGSRRWRD